MKGCVDVASPYCAPKDGLLGEFIGSPTCMYWQYARPLAPYCIPTTLLRQFIVAMACTTKHVWSVYGLETVQRSAHELQESW